MKPVHKNQQKVIVKIKILHVNQRIFVELVIHLVLMEDNVLELISILMWLWENLEEWNKMCIRLKVKFIEEDQWQYQWMRNHWWIIKEAFLRMIQQVKSKTMQWVWLDGEMKMEKNFGLWEIVGDNIGEKWDCLEWRLEIIYWELKQM